MTLQVEGKEPCVCWCCGRSQDPTRVVPLGDHPEVTLCLDCAHLASKRASAIQDRDRTGAAVQLRGLLRTARGFVISHGLHEHPLLGRPLPWLGRHTP